MGFEDKFRNFFYMGCGAETTYLTLSDLNLFKEIIKKET